MTEITATIPMLGGGFTIRMDGPVIASIEPSDRPTDLFAGPTLFDIQVNGYGGRTCSLQSAEQKSNLAHISKLMQRHGVGWWVPTVCTDTPERLATAFRLLGEALDEDAATAAAIPGLHLEGPYLSAEDGPRGVHPLACVRDPDWDEFQRLQELSGGRILYITLAPERSGAPAFIRRAVASGVVVSIGHSNLDRESLQAAVEAGATMSTHLGNGAHDRLQRHNNYLWYQLACRDTFASFISDGHHLPDECLYALIHAKGLELSVITSDTTELGGLPPGIYGNSEKLPSGRVNCMGTTNLAGSANHLLDCVENVARAARLPHAEAWRLGSVAPARLLGLEGRLGVAAGKEASLTVYRMPGDGAKIEIVATWVRGRKVFDAATAEPVVMPDTPDA
jgi:N-acetylglucosamine-6-phosphate deacetylase